MRLASLAAAITLFGCVTAAAEPIEVTAAVPGGIAVTSWCWRFPDAGCRRQADDAARARCQSDGGKARFVRSALLQRTYRHGQKGLYLYDCMVWTDFCSSLMSTIPPLITLRYSITFRSMAADCARRGPAAG